MLAKDLKDTIYTDLMSLAQTNLGFKLNLLSILQFIFFGESQT